MGEAAPDFYIQSLIVSALRAMRGGCGTSGSIAVRLKISRTMVEHTLDDMVHHGMLDCVACDGAGMSDLYRNIVNGVPVGVLPPRFTGGDNSEQDGDCDVLKRDLEVEQAASLWQARMGSDRWHDDPRAKSEVRGSPHLLPISERRL